MAKAKKDELEAALDELWDRQMERVKTHASEGIKGVACLMRSLSLYARTERSLPDGYAEAMGVIEREMKSCGLAVSLICRNE